MAAGWALAACGSSPDSAALTSSNQLPGATSNGAGGFVTNGGAPVGGALTGAGGFLGAGGTPFGGTAAQTGAGGVLGGAGFSPGAGGTAVDAGLPSAAGSSPGAGGAFGSGGVPEAGASTDPFPPGGLISVACSDCARTRCASEEAQCAADPACLAVGKCLSTCLGAACLACITTLGSQTAQAEFFAVADCTNQKCQPECPMITTGGGGTNP